MNEWIIKLKLFIFVNLIINICDYWYFDYGILGYKIPLGFSLFIEIHSEWIME